jgi:signal transduction histidine kinase
MRHVDGSWRWLVSRGTVFSRNADGTAKQILGMAQDITERRRAERALRQSRTQLRHLARQVQTLQEEERKRIARAIHDELAQDLVAMKMDFAWLNKRLTRVAAPTQARLREMAAVSEHLLATVYRIATDLRPGMLDDLGLTAALEWHLQEVQRRTAVEVVVESEPATALFRIFQEALSNVVRHAQASQVTVEVAQSSEVICLKVHDNGKGICPGQMADPAALGLLGMRERAELWGGHVTVIGKPGYGTTVTVWMPCESTMRGGRADDQIAHC